MFPCRDILDRPIAGTPGAETILKDRVSYDLCWNFECVVLFREYIFRHYNAFATEIIRWCKINAILTLSFRYSGTTSKVLNLGSYNYLGFAQNDGQCAKDAESIIDQHGIGVCSNLHEYGAFTFKCVRNFI